MNKEYHDLDLIAFAASLPTTSSDANRVRALVRDCWSGHSDLDDLNKANRELQALADVTVLTTRPIERRALVGRFNGNGPKPKSPWSNAREWVFDRVYALQAWLREGPFDTKRAEASRSTIGAALFGSAVVHYASATTTSSKWRAKANYESKYSDELKVGHNRIMDIRNHAIAHAGQGDRQSPWRKKLMILRFWPDAPEFFYPSMIWNYRAEDCQLLADLIDAAINLAQQRVREKELLLHQFFDHFLVESRMEDLFLHDFDADQFFGTNEAAKIAFAQRSKTRFDITVNYQLHPLPEVE